MLDNVLIAKIITVMNAGLASIGQGSIVVKQAYQPKQEGANSAPSMYLHKISDEIMGMPLRQNVWDVDSGTMKYTETQQYLTTFQISGLAVQTPSNTTQLTASDIVNYGRYVLQHLNAITSFEADGIGILRVGQVRNPYFVNDRDRFEASPSFDFVLSHKQTIISTQPIISTYEVNTVEI